MTPVAGPGNPKLKMRSMFFFSLAFLGASCSPLRLFTHLDSFWLNLLVCSPLFLAISSLPVCNMPDSLP